MHKIILPDKESFELIENDYTTEELKSIVCIYTGIPKNNIYFDMDKQNINVYYLYPIEYQYSINEINIPEIVNKSIKNIITNVALQLLTKSNIIMTNYLLNNIFTIYDSSRIRKNYNLFQILCIVKSEMVSTIYPLMDKQSSIFIMNYVDTLKICISKSSNEIFELVSQDELYDIKSDKNNLLLFSILYSNFTKKILFFIEHVSVLPDTITITKNGHTETNSLVNMLISKIQSYYTEEYIDPIKKALKFIAKTRPDIILVKGQPSPLEKIKNDILFETVLYLYKDVDIAYEDIESLRHMPSIKNENNEHILFSVVNPILFKKIIISDETLPLEDVNKDGDTFYMKHALHETLGIFHLEYFIEKTDKQIILNKNKQTFIHLLFTNVLSQYKSYILNHWDQFLIMDVINYQDYQYATPLYNLLWINPESDLILKKILNQKQKINHTLVYEDGNTIFFCPNKSVFLLFSYYYLELDYFYQNNDGQTMLTCLIINFLKNNNSIQENGEEIYYFMSYLKNLSTKSYTSLDLVDKLGNTSFHWFCFFSPSIKIKSYEKIINLFKSFTEPPYSCSFSSIRNKKGQIPTDLTKYIQILNVFNVRGKAFKRPTLIDHDIIHPFVTKPLINPNIDLTIISLNMYNGQCSNKSEILDILPYADVIMTQENDTSLFLLPNQSSCGKNSETVGLYTIKDNSIKCIETSPNHLPSSIKNRYGFITIVKGIKIANIHLEGGRFSDLLLFTEKREEIMMYKLELLKKIILEEPDIIVGDFNSVYGKLDSQYAYFEKIKKSPLTELDRIFIISLNREPFSILEKNGYTYAEPRNNTITSQLGKTIVDLVWYKKDKINLEDCYIIDLPFINGEYCISDHNPVIASFSINGLDKGDEKIETFPIVINPTCNKTIYECDETCMKRLQSGPKIQAFHATTQKLAIKIWNSGQFLCGVGGTQGSGIYLCPRPLDCIYKANFGDDKYIFLFELEVLMGNSVVLDRSYSINPNMDIYDSVIYLQQNGIEYVVFRPMQVHIKSMYRILGRNLTSMTFSYTQERSTSFSDINHYVLGGWNYINRKINSILDLGPYQLNTIVDKINKCTEPVENTITCYNGKIVPVKSFKDMSWTGTSKNKRHKLHNKSKRQHKLHNKSKRQLKK